MLRGGARVSIKCAPYLRVSNISLLSIFAYDYFVVLPANN